MTLTLVATAASSSANTYCTLAEAETYFEKRLHKDTWDDASSSDKNTALVWATRLLDEQVEWVGTRWTKDQALQWPRYSVYDRDGFLLDHNSIPTFLKEAVAEFAMHLIVEDRQADPDTQGFRYMQLGDMKLGVDKRWQKPVLPISVWHIIKFYGSKAQGKTRFLVRG